MERMDQQNAIEEVNEQLRALLLSRFELSMKEKAERVGQGRPAWSIVADTALLANMTRGLSPEIAHAMQKVWEIILQEERKLYFQFHHRW